MLAVDKFGKRFMDGYPPAKIMMPIKNPPFYVMEAWPPGARRQAARARSDEETDPRLYVAGEISSIYGHLYLEAGNIIECFVAGKIAGENAAAEKDWD